MAMPILLLDPHEAAETRQRYVVNGSAHYGCDERRTEAWNGVEVVPPLPNDEHQEIQFNLAFPFAAVVREPGAGYVRMGVNVSDRADGWIHNYRAPDLVVYLHANSAINHGAFWEGGPDFLVEILSPGELPYAKFDFYAAVGTREVLLVFRDPWALELHRLDGDRLQLAGRTEGPTLLVSDVLQLTFALRPDSPRPIITVAHPPTGRTWDV